MIPAIALLALLDARAGDVEGLTAPVPTGDLRDPIAATSPWIPPAGQASGAILLDAPWRPLVAGQTPADCVEPCRPDSFDQVAVDSLVGAQLAAGYAPSRRLALGLTARTRLYTRGLEDPSASGPLVGRGPSLSDLRLWVPVAVVRSEGAGVAVVPHVDLPMSDPAALDGQAAGGGLRASAGARTEALQGSIELGAGFHPQPEGSPLPGDWDWSARIGGGWEPADGVGLVAELEGRRAAAAAPPAVEARLAARLGTGRIQGTLGAGLPMTAAPTVPLARGVLELRWVPRGPAAQRIGDLVVALRDPEGRPLTPLVDVDGEAGEVRQAKGGLWTVDLEEGPHQVGVGADGFGRQVRLIETGAGEPARIEATLLPQRGDGTTRLAVRDPSDRPVADATLELDGVTLGHVGADGVLVVEGLAPRPVRVRASAPGLLAMEPVERALDDGAPVYLDRPPGQVWLRVHAAGVPVPDAAVRILGPETLQVPSLDHRGEALFEVPPGDWIAVVSSPAHGLQQRTLRIEEGERQLTEVIVDLRPPAGSAKLRVELRDPDGRPIDSARVWLDDEPLANTSSGGVLVVEGLEARAGAIRAEAPRMLPSESLAVDLTSGLAEVVLPMRWRPGSVRVIARSEGGPVQHAQVRFVGASSQPAQDLGPDGRLETTLEPGSWTAVVAAPSLGVQARDLEIEPDRTSLVVVEAVLAARESGDAALDLRVVDPLGLPVEGARVFVDAIDRGTTSAGGHLRLEGLDAAARSVRIESSLHDPWEKARVMPAEQVARLGWRRGVVALRATAGTEPVDAMVRLVGPAPIPTLSLGPSGLRRVALPLGTWTAVAAAERHGVQSVDVEVVGADRPQPVEIAFGEPGSATAIAALPARPVPIRTLLQATGERVGAAVRVYGVDAMPQQDTAPTGEVVVSLRPGSWTAIASAADLGLADRDFVVATTGALAAVELPLGPATLEERDGVVRFIEEVRFATGEARLLDDSRAMLEDVVRTLRIRPSVRLVEVQGHTDDIGSAEGNLELSTRRAQAVRDYLVAAGISPSRLVARGYGLARPKESNQTEVGRAANRRVELHILEVTGR